MLSAETWQMLKDLVNLSEGVFDPTDFEVKQTPTGKQVSARRHGGGSHPWKCSSNGDGTVAVATGKILFWLGSGDPMVMGYHKATAVDTVTVTGAGYIYYKYQTTAVLLDWHNEGQGSGDHDEELYNFGGYSASGAFEFNATAPGALAGTTTDLTISHDYIYLLVAEVSLSSGVAVVDEQVMQDNQTVSIQSLKEGSP